MTDTEAPPRALVGRDTALFLDFDGTLSDLRDDPDAVHLPEGGGAVLEGLAGALDGALALVSGRDARDLTSRTPLSLWRAGNHGGIVLEPGRAVPDEVPEPPEVLVRVAGRIAAGCPGVFVEEKAAVLAVHTRAQPDREPQILDELREAVASVPGYKLQHGKRVIELKPDGVDKGVVIERLCQAAPFAGRKPVFLGDDTTDEDGFAVVLAMGGEAVKVGEGETQARYRLDGPDAVWAWLRTTHDALS